MIARITLCLLAGLCVTGGALADALPGKRSFAEILDAAPEDAWRTVDPDALLIIALETGDVIVELSPDLAQGHVAHIKGLARAGFYDGLTFYRVIDGFVAQGGDQNDERDTSPLPRTIPAEFDETPAEDLAFTPIGTPDGYAPEAGFINGFPSGRDMQANRVWHAHCAGAMAMARDEDPDTGGTEFYITLHPHRYLDRNLSVFGRVWRGMEHVQKLNRVQPTEEGGTTGEGAPGIIRSMKIASDLPETEQPRLQVFDTNSPLFPELIEARRNRPESFFHFRPDHTDICAIPMPVRDEPESED